MAKKQLLARKRMKEARVEETGDVVKNGEWLYRYFSDSAHHRRGPITTSVSLERREFAYGPHPDPAKRGQEVEHAGQMIETALIVVADSLAYIVGREGPADVLAEQAAELDQVRTAHPIA